MGFLTSLLTWTSWKSSIIYFLSSKIRLKSWIKCFISWWPPKEKNGSQNPPLSCFLNDSLALSLFFPIFIRLLTFLLLISTNSPQPDWKVCSQSVLNSSLPRLQNSQKKTPPIESKEYFQISPPECKNYSNNSITTLKMDSFRVKRLTANTTKHSNYSSRDSKNSMNTGKKSSSRFLKLNSKENHIPSN